VSTQDPSPNELVDTWVAISGDRTITIRTGKVELGQGLITALARIAAEELDVDLGRIRVETADTARPPEEFPTVGSLSMQQTGTTVRQAAACARAALLAKAAGRLGVAIEHLTVLNGVVADERRELRTTYWELQEGQDFGIAIDADVVPKQAALHRIVGAPGQRLDLEGMVTGATRYVQDLGGPDVLHARVVRPPSPAAELLSVEYDDLQDVLVIRDGSFLAVCGEDEGQVLKARALLAARAKWVEPETLPDQRGLSEWLVEQSSLDFPVVDGVARPDLAVTPHRPPPDAAHRIGATFTRGYLVHGAIGPSAARALWRDGRLTVWSHSQAIHMLKASLAEVLGVDASVVRVVHVPGPGCYGHNGADDAALDAALVAQYAGERPVLMKWTREDEHSWEPYGPAAVVRTSASVDAQGRIVDWSLDVWSQTHLRRPVPAGDRSGLLVAWHREDRRVPPEIAPVLSYHGGIHRNADPLYEVGTRRVVKHLIRKSPMRTSSLRSLGAHVNVLAIESTMDELAEAAAVDPLEFRLRHLADPRAKEVLETAAAHAGWTGRSSELGEGRGLGFARYKNAAAYAAVVAELSVDLDDASVRVRRVVVAADAGETIDPSGLTNQLEGGVVQSISWTLKEEVSFDATRVTSIDWDSYPILRISETPEIETIVLDRPGQPFLGAGEVVQGPVAAALANAIYDATGIRVRDLPFTPARLRRAALET
jgi:nicotinate dehydrogenase subunit B